MNILISVIIPVYNEEKFLSKCIESVINQTYKNIEILLIDDGSTDNSPKLCDEYSQKDSRIKVIHKLNGGLSSARNAGINLAHGEYLYFLDSDDYINKYSIEILMRPIQGNSEIDVSIGGVEKVTDSGEIDDREENYNLIDSGSIHFTEIQDFNSLFQVDFWMVAWGKLFKRTLFNDLCFPLGKLHEDEFIAYKIFDKCNKISFCQKKLYKYRQHKNSIMASFSIQRVDNAFEAMTEALSYFNSKNNLYCQYYYGQRLSIYLINLNRLSRDYTEIDFKKYEKEFFRVSFKYLKLETKFKYIIKRVLLILKLL